MAYSLSVKDIVYSSGEDDDDLDPTDFIAATGLKTVEDEERDGEEWERDQEREEERERENLELEEEEKRLPQTVEQEREEPSPDSSVRPGSALAAEAGKFDSGKRERRETEERDDSEREEGELEEGEVQELASSRPLLSSLSLEPTDKHRSFKRQRLESPYLSLGNGRGRSSYPPGLNPLARPFSPLLSSPLPLPHINRGMPPLLSHLPGRGMPRPILPTPPASSFLSSSLSLSRTPGLLADPVPPPLLSSGQRSTHAPLVPVQSGSQSRSRKRERDERERHDRERGDKREREGRERERREREAEGDERERKRTERAGREREDSERGGRRERGETERKDNERGERRDRVDRDGKDRRERERGDKERRSPSDKSRDERGRTAYRTARQSREREDEERRERRLPSAEKLLSLSRSINLANRERTRAILVENLPNKIDESTIFSLLSKAGKIETLKINWPKAGLAYVRFVTASAAADARRQFNRHKVEENIVSVTFVPDS